MYKYTKQEKTDFHFEIEILEYCSSFDFFIENIGLFYIFKMKKVDMSMYRICWYENNFVDFLHTILLYYLSKKKVLRMT